MGPTNFKYLKKRLADLGLRLGMPREEIEARMARVEATKDQETKEHEIQELTPVMKDVLPKRVEETGLSRYETDRLQGAGIMFVWQLLEINEKDLLKRTGFNRERLYEIKKILGERGLWLGMGISLQGWNSFQKENLAGGSGMEEDAPDIFYDLDEETGNPVSDEDPDMVGRNPHDGRTAALSHSLAARLQRPGVRINLLTKMGR